MTGIDDLRGALDRRADQATRDSLDTTSRAVQVRGRVAVVRRRRRQAATGGAALAVLAAVGLATLVPGGGSAPGPQPAATTVVGQKPPPTLVSNGWTYELQDVVEGDGAVALDLEPADVPRLVTWATGGSEQDVLVRDQGESARYRTPDFADFVSVAPGEEHSVEVVGRTTADAPVGLAVYTLSDDPALVPDGFTSEGVTFRREVGDRTLVQAAVGVPGASEVQLPLVGSREGRLGLSVLCAGSPEGSRAEVEIDGTPAYSTGCTSTTTFDPGSTQTIQDVVHPSALVELRLTDADGDVLEGDDVQVGLGAYLIPSDAEGVLGSPMPQVIERAGRRWELTSTVQSEPGGRELSDIAGAGDGPWWVELARRGAGTLVPSVDGRERTMYTTNLGTPSSGGVGLVSAGAEVRVGLRPMGGGGLEAALVYYRLAE